MKDKREDSKEYTNKKAFFDKIITIYGRNALLEALSDESLEIYKLHLSDSNKKAPIIDKLITMAEKRDIEIAYHNNKALSRISKNAKQDQGVALDIILKHSINEEDFIKKSSTYRLLALDGVTNPQNLGMIIRSATAGNIDAIILPTKGVAQISPLVIKASVGTIFHIPIIKSDKLYKTLKNFQSNGAEVYTLSSYAESSYTDTKYSDKTIFVLGNESEGVSSEIEKLSDKSISIPMKRGVESLNVAVTASLLAFYTFS
ncbi:RNA methyltransferase, TrmA family [hydrothermal vent metagenome]|uniref:RNA methyltransferase, TrmA family n=1 Tax=hydrothermal vent metagenome TaxID=652676 RepID=A0A1W1BYJ6_9ZZZZ